MLLVFLAAVDVVAQVAIRVKKGQMWEPKWKQA